MPLGGSGGHRARHPFPGEERPTAILNVGSLVEVDLPDCETPLADTRLAHALRDMRLLGLQPTLLAPQRI
jgi:hypothetical protein